MNILNAIKNIPAGILLIPMFISAIINTFFPEIVNSGEPVKSLLSGDGLMTLLAMNLFVAGSQLKVKELPQLLRKALFLGGGRIVITLIASFSYIQFFGIEGFYGISIVAFVAAIASTNPGIYLSLVAKHGKGSDKAVFPILSFITQPLIPLFILSFGSGSSLDFSSTVALFLPFILGIVMGNMSSSIRDMFSKATMVILPFWGISVGSKINLIDAVSSLESGVLLAALFLIICLLPMVLADKVINRSNGFTAAATCTVAAVCIIVPELAANMNPAYAPYVQTAQNQLATAVVITSILVPFLAKKLLHFGERKGG